MNLSNFFDKIFLITCYHTKDRLCKTIPYLNSRGIYPDLFFSPLKERFHYMYYNEQAIWPGASSLSCAYEQLFQKCIFENVNTALFIEDDILLADDWEDKIKSIWFNSNKEWYILKDGNASQFFAMSKEAMIDFLNKYAANGYPVDYAINNIQDTKVTNKTNIRIQPGVISGQLSNGWNALKNEMFSDKQKIPSGIEIRKDLRHKHVFS